MTLTLKVASTLILLYNTLAYDNAPTYKVWLQMAQKFRKISSGQKNLRHTDRLTRGWWGWGAGIKTKAHQFLPSITKVLTEYAAPDMNKRHSIRQQYLNKPIMVLVPSLDLDRGQHSH